MAVFISTSTDAFAQVFADNSQERPVAAIRRPMRGIQIKEDTHAVIRVITSTGVEIPLIDSSARSNQFPATSPRYANFILQSVQEQRVEKQQIIETFGEDYIFFFGERPRFLNVTGILLNTADFNWKSEFWENYEKHFRGTRLVEQNARMYLNFDDVVVEGYITAASTVQSTESPYMLPLQFQMFVTNYALLSDVGSPYFQPSGAQSGGIELPPPSGEGAASAMTTAVSQASSGGGLISFLSAASEFANNATFSIQNTLEILKSKYFEGRVVAANEALGSAVGMPTISNEASFPPGRTGRPIYEMNDEYIGGQVQPPNYDESERARVQKELSLRTPEQLEAKAREMLAEMGLSTEERVPSYLLLGVGAFAKDPSVTTFGLVAAQGTLDLAGIDTDVIDI